MSITFETVQEKNDIKDIWECFEWKAEIIKAVSFIPFGFGSTVCNILLVAAILSSRCLRYRCEMRIICALSFAELIEAAATLMGGLYRTSIILLHRIDNIFTPTECMLLPHSWMWRWSDFATSFMLLCLTLDRLLSVMIPLRYITFGTTYSTVAIGITYSISALFSLFAWHHPLTVHANLSMLCTTVFLSTSFYQFSKYMTSVATMLSVLLYTPVIYLTRKQFKMMSSRLNVSQVQKALQTDGKRRAQLHMTVTIAIQSASTLLLDAIPRAVGVYGTALTTEGTQCESAMGMLFHLTKLNSMVALGLYYWRNKIIRQSIDGILRRKGKSNGTAAFASVMPISPGQQVFFPTSTRRRLTTVLPVQHSTRSVKKPYQLN